MLGTAHDLSAHRGARAVALAAMLAALIGLALPTLASAASGYEVEGTGDGAKSVPGDECETTAGECTFRAAIEAANDGPDRDRIFFSSVFHGDTGATLVLGSALPAITQPVRIDATPCQPGPQAPPFPCVPVVAPAGTVGIDVQAGETAVEGLIISGAEIGIRLAGASAGGKVEGNEIHTPSSSNATAIEILNGPNDVYANKIEGSCCLAAIVLQGNASGNRIGGDTVQSENVIDGFQNGAIAMTLPETSRNEVGRNRGANGGSFIDLLKANSAEPGLPNQIDPPAVGGAFESSAGGSARPGAVVRLFRKATSATGEIEGFLGQATADGAGNWKVVYPKVTPGSLVAATQTLGGGTSALSGAASAAVDPPPDNGGGGSGGGGSAGGAGSSTGGATGSGVAEQGPPAPAVTAVAPRARISAGPAGRIEATTARFRFTSHLAGARFQCRLDRAKFSGCRSPRTYRHLEPGKHVFRVRAVGPTGLLGSVTRRTFTVS